MMKREEKKREQPDGNRQGFIYAISFSKNKKKDIFRQPGF